ncbi:ABC transporter ATP-binding protein [Paenibacillus sp.]|uniref:ABC transporter ATP-binding protein n=1 Tax=Paenibacillus sp. TaxID=58172 RepID=UPI002D5E3CE6|nr:ABC transporter ATP-binding protein [Paenibacillus sp.]HZG56307.1 ABC transporter ATP-binding protein [Paenibacillus sp.]
MIECEGLVKIYKTETVEAVALQGLNLSVRAGEMMAIIGNSGSGKSTLLNILGGLDRPSAGTARVGSWNLLTMTDKQLAEYTRTTVGFVWQNNARNLLPYLTALENVETAMMFGRRPDYAYAKTLLASVGLEERMHNKLHQLSGGEQQRVAIAIALANRPPLLLADEPTGSVDSRTSDQIMGVFRALNRELGVTIVIVTHDLALAKQVDRVVAIRDGMTSSEWLRKADAAQGAGSAEAGADEGGLAGRSAHVEYAVLDKAGRLQVPREFLDRLGATDKVVLEWDGTRVTIGRPDASEASA